MITAIILGYNPTLSLTIQKYYFKLGYRWPDNDPTHNDVPDALNQPILVLYNNDKILTYRRNIKYIYGANYIINLEG